MNKKIKKILSQVRAWDEVNASDMVSLEFLASDDGGGYCLFTSEEGDAGYHYELCRVRDLHPAYKVTSRQAYKKLVKEVRYLIGE